MGLRILVVEDEPKLGLYLRKGLAENGCVVDVVNDGLDGVHYATEGDYDLVLLDVMLPGMDGFAILEKLRKTCDTPVLMLTARDKVEDRVRGLQSGADDCLVKPFSFSELLARIRALLRRGRTHESTKLRLADLELDLVKRKAFRGGARLDLTAKEFALLRILLQRQGEILSRTTLAEQPGAARGRRTPRHLGRQPRFPDPA